MIPTTAPPAPAVPGAAETPQPSTRLSTPQKWLLGLLGFLLGAVVLAPIALSFQDLYDWAVSITGLNQPPERAVLVPIALDIAAAACIVMTIIAAIWKRQRAGFFGFMVWIFAGVSAYAQYSHGIAERNAGRAQDAWWAFPLIALLGPLLLEMVLKKFRNWMRKEFGETLDGAAGFGTRWIPFVAFRETAMAWAASRREGIATAIEAIAFVRAQKAIKNLSDQDAIRYAFGELKIHDPHAARIWLQSRGREVGQSAIDQAIGVEDALQAMRHEVAALELRAHELETARTARMTAIENEIDQEQQKLDKLRADSEIQPSLAEVAAERNKTFAVHVAHSAMSGVSNLTAAGVVAFLRERGVIVSEALVHKARMQARQAAGLDALIDAGAEHNVYDLRPRGAAGAQ